MSQINVFDPQDIEKNKVYALLSYLGFLFIIPLLAAKDSPYAKFHANQGFVLFITGIALNIANTIVSIVLGILTSIPAMGWIFGMLIALVNLAVYIIGVLLFILMIIGIINAVKGEAKELPVIGKFVIIK